MRMFRQRVMMMFLTLLVAILPGTTSLAQQLVSDECVEVTTLSNNVFDMVRDVNKERIKKSIRASAKLYKVDCLRLVISRFGGLGRLAQFLGGSIWSRIGTLDLNQMLCNAVLDNLPDDFNGATGTWESPLDVLAEPGTMADDRRRRLVARRA